MWYDRLSPTKIGYLKALLAMARLVFSPSPRGNKFTQDKIQKGKKEKAHIQKKKIFLPSLSLSNIVSLPRGHLWTERAKVNCTLSNSFVKLFGC